MNLVLDAYNGSLIAALLDLFSDIGLERSKFIVDPSVYKSLLTVLVSLFHSFCFLFFVFCCIYLFSTQKMTRGEPS